MPYYAIATANIISWIDKTKCLDRGSNAGPSDLQSDALPTELSRRWPKGLNA